jgi:hypothetical protein
VKPVYFCGTPDFVCGQAGFNNWFLLALIVTFPVAAIFCQKKLTAAGKNLVFRDHRNVIFFLAIINLTFFLLVPEMRIHWLRHMHKVYSGVSATSDYWIIKNLWTFWALFLQPLLLFLMLQGTRRVERYNAYKILLSVSLSFMIWAAHPANYFRLSVGESNAMCELARKKAYEIQAERCGWIKK